jgi:hypothetical protein
VPRPKNQDLTGINLRLVKAQLEALDKIVAAERDRRGDPTLNRTDLIREAIAELIRRYERRK